MENQTATKSLSKISDEVLYERYVAPVALFAVKLEAAAPYNEFPLLATFKDHKDFTAHSEIIADVAATSYCRFLKEVPRTQLLHVMHTLWRKVEEQVDKTVSDENVTECEGFLCCATVEELFKEEKEDSLIWPIAFLFYHMMAVMKLGLVFNRWNQMSSEERVRHFIDMHVCLERAEFALVWSIDKKMPSPREMAKRGGKKRFESLYGSAREYTLRRYQELRAQKPHISKMQIAKIIDKEAENLAEFRVMSPDNRERTIYDWVRSF